MRIKLQFVGTSDVSGKVDGQFVVDTTNYHFTPSEAGPFFDHDRQPSRSLLFFEFYRDIWESTIAVSAHQCIDQDCLEFFKVGPWVARDHVIAAHDESPTHGVDRVGFYPLEANARRIPTVSNRFNRLQGKSGLRDGQASREKDSYCKSAQ